MKDYKSIEEFDKEQEEKYLKEQENKQENEQENEQEVTDEEKQEIVTEDDFEEQEEIEEDEKQDEQEEEIDEQEEEKEENITTKKVDKKEYAFKELRKEKEKYKKQYEEASTLQNEFDELAKSLGYQNSEELLKVEKEKRLREAAKSQGIEPEFYLEFQKMKEELAKEKRNKQETINKSRVQQFSGALELVAKNNNLSQKDVESIISNIEKDGYNIEDLYEIKNPKRFIEGYAYDKILEKEKQNMIKKSKKNEFKEDQFNKTSSSKKTKEQLQQELIKEEMRKYAKENGLDYS